MSDKKISELPSASTPLAGTEAVPIVQGGITEQVSVANLTDGRDVSAKSLIVSDNSANAALRITQIGAGNALLVEDSANPDATPFVINNSGAALVGVDATRTLFTAYTPSLQVEGTTSSTFSQSITANINTSASPVMFFAKSRGTTNGSNTIVSANDTLGVISFNGADGTDIQSTAAQIVAAVDGTPGADDMPGRLVFSTTADGASTSTERMRITSAGFVGIGTTTPLAPLEVTSASGSIVVRGTDLTSRSLLLAAASDYSTSFRTTFISQHNASATGTTLGLSNANLGSLGFQNGSNAVIYSNGLNILRLGTNATTAINIASNQVISLGAAPGSESLRVTPVASAVNYLEVTGAATGGSLAITAAGSDTNIGIRYIAKTAANHQFQTGGSAINQFVVQHQASAVNYLQVAGAATGSAPSMSAVGSDTNIDLTLTPKGTGNVRFGTYTAGILAQAGYIQIKDAAGNTRNLLVG